MSGVTAVGGLADAQARVASIRSRIAQLSPQPTASSFSLEPATRAGTAGAPTTATPAPAPAVLGTPAPALPSATGTGEATAAQARLEQALPAAGKRWAGAIADAAATHDLDPGLLAALVENESGFDPAARSHAGALGLGQLMPGTAAGLGVDPSDPVQNLDGAARYLKQQLDRFGSADLALAAYNAGPGRVAQAGGVPNITETRTYVDRVLRTWEQYR